MSSEEKRNAARRNDRKNAAKGPAGRARKKIVLAVVCLFLLASLTAGGLLLFLPRGEVYSMGGAVLDGEMYNFWFATLKSKYMKLYGIRGTQDTAVFWESACTQEGVDATWGDFLTEKIDGEIRAKLTAAALYDETGQSLTIAERAEIDTYFEREVDTAGGEAAFAELAKQYKTSAEAVRKCALLELKADALYSYLYKNDLPAADKEAFYAALYTRVKLLYFKNIQDVSKAQQVSAAMNVLNGAIAEGGNVTEETFDGYLSLSDDPTHAEDRYPNGLYLYPGLQLSENGEETYPAAVEEKLFSLRAGELVRISAGEGVWYLLGYALDAGAYDKKENADFFGSFYFAAGQWSYNKFIAGRMSDVRVNERNHAELPGIAELPYCTEILRYLD